MKIDKAAVRAQTALARQRLRAIYYGPQQPHLLSLKDIARELRTSYDWLRAHARPKTPRRCKHACPSIDDCQASQNCRDMNPGLRRDILRFFEQWDCGEVVKGHVNGEWRLIRYANQAARREAARPPAWSPPPRTIHLTIDRATLGLKVK